LPNDATPSATEPVGDAPSQLRLRLVVDRVVAASTRPLDRAVRRVFEQRVEVRSVAEAERLLTEAYARDATSTRLGTWVALATSLRPLIRQIMKRASTATKVAKLSGSGRMAAWGITGTLAAGRVVEATRLGISELQVMAAFLHTRLQDRGQRASPRSVELAVLSLYTKPSRRLDLDQTRRAGLSTAARRWVLEAFHSESDKARQRRMRSRLQAIAELPDEELRRLVDVIPATIRPEAPKPLTR
jgi:hypothetical protein